MILLENPALAGSCILEHGSWFLAGLKWSLADWLAMFQKTAWKAGNQFFAGPWWSTYQLVLVANDKLEE